MMTTNLALTLKEPNRVCCKKSNDEGGGTGGIRMMWMRSSARMYRRSCDVSHLLTRLAHSTLSFPKRMMNVTVGSKNEAANCRRLERSTWSKRGGLQDLLILRWLGEAVKV